MTTASSRKPQYLSGSRLAWVKSWLESGGSLNASTIIARFGVCRRTAARDIRFLQKHFGLPLVYDASAKVFYLQPEGIPVDDSMSARYAKIIAEAMPKLTAAEWAAIREVNCLGGSPVDTLPMRVATWDGLEVDQAALADKLRRMPFVSLCAVDEATRVHHNRAKGG